MLSKDTSNRSEGGDAEFREELQELIEGVDLYEVVKHHYTDQEIDQLKLPPRPEEKDLVDEDGKTVLKGGVRERLRDIGVSNPDLLKEEASTKEMAEKQIEAFQSLTNMYSDELDSLIWRQRSSSKSLAGVITDADHLISSWELPEVPSKLEWRKFSSNAFHGFVATTGPNCNMYGLVVDKKSPKGKNLPISQVQFEVVDPKAELTIGLLSVSYSGNSLLVGSHHIHIDSNILAVGKTTREDRLLVAHETGITVIDTKEIGNPPYDHIMEIDICESSQSITSAAFSPDGKKVAAILAGPESNNTQMGQAFTFNLPEASSLSKRNVLTRLFGKTRPYYGTISPYATFDRTKMPIHSQFSWSKDGHRVGALYPKSLRVNSNVKFELFDIAHHSFDHLLVADRENHRKAAIFSTNDDFDKVCLNADGSQVMLTRRNEAFLYGKGNIDDDEAFHFLTSS